MEPIFMSFGDIFPSFKVGQTKVENMHFSRLSWRWNFKVGLDTHLKVKHGHLILWDLELVWPSFKVGQTKVEKMHFCWISWNWFLQVDLGTHLRHNHGHLILWYLELFWPSFKLVKPMLKWCTFFDFLWIESWKWI